MIGVPHFNYGDIVYKSCTQYNLDRLQKMPKQAATIISVSSHQTQHNDMYTELTGCHGKPMLNAQMCHSVYIF